MTDTDHVEILRCVYAIHSFVSGPERLMRLSDLRLLASHQYQEGYYLIICELYSVRVREGAPGSLPAARTTTTRLRVILSRVDCLTLITDAT